MLKFGIYYIIILLSALSIWLIVRLNEIEKKIQTKDIHYLLPDTADCAVKMMFFKDSKGNALPGEVRKVCHWRQK